MDEIAIRPLTAADREAALEVINSSAQWYAEFLPAEHLYTPEMGPAEWGEEARRMTWYGAFAGRRLLGVMGLEFVRDVALIRHGYVLPEAQRGGVGSMLLRHLEMRAGGVARVVIGTYAANHKARAALEKAGYVLSADSQAVLRAYFAIPSERAATSVTYEKPATS